MDQIIIINAVIIAISVITAWTMDSTATPTLNDHIKTINAENDRHMGTK